MKLKPASMNRERTNIIMQQILPSSFQ